MEFHVAQRQRLDHYLTRKYPDISRGFLQKLIANEQVLVNDVPQKSGYKLHATDKIRILYDMDKIGKPVSIDLPILYEDQDILVVNKPAGVLSHALSKFHTEPSVASFLRQHIHKLIDSELDIRFGIVHRLDRLTSGVMICAKTHDSLRFLQEQFASRKVKKTYVAVVKGEPETAHALLDWPIERNPKAPATFRVGPNGKEAQTEYKLLKSNSIYSLLELKPQTGRTHQLRVHLKHLGYPIVGDLLYEGEPADRLYLHAYKLSLRMKNGNTKIFTAPLPLNFKKYLDVVT
jgi:23S rRNA pseudouridine1911/1915/1917 synthase